MPTSRRTTRSSALPTQGARGRSRSPTPKKLTASEIAMAKAKARRASKSPAPKATAKKVTAKKLVTANSPAPAMRTTRARSKSPAPTRRSASLRSKSPATNKLTVSPKSVAMKKVAATRPARTQNRSKSPVRKTAAKSTAKKMAPASATPPREEKSQKARLTASEAAMLKARERRASKSPARSKKATSKKEPRSPRRATRTLHDAAKEAATESYFENEAEEGSNYDCTDSTAQEEAEAAAFQKFLYVVLTAIALTLACAPAPPESCNGIGITSLVQGVSKNGAAPTILKTWKCAAEYRDTHPSFTLALICAIYVALQTCAIPGPVVLAVVAGGLYGFWGAQLLNAVCAGTGASFCALLSKKWGRGRLKALGMNEKVAQFRDAVQEHKDSLFMYMLMTRVTPVPNVVVNMASPHLGVPLWMLAVTTPIGQFLFNCFYSTLGKTLNDAASLDETEFTTKFAQNTNTIQIVCACSTVICALFVVKARMGAAEAKVE